MKQVDLLETQTPFALSKASPLRRHGVTRKQPLFEMIFNFLSACKQLILFAHKSCFLRA